MTVTETKTATSSIETRRFAYIRNCKRLYRDALISLEDIGNRRYEAYSRLLKAGASATHADIALNYNGFDDSPATGNAYFHYGWVLRTPLKTLREWLANDSPRWVVLLDPVRHNYLRNFAAMAHYRDGSGTTVFASEAHRFSRKGAEEYAEMAKKFYPNARVDTLAAMFDSPRS